MRLAQQELSEDHRHQQEVAHARHQPAVVDTQGNVRVAAGPQP
jgi:hypothetical protein